MEPCKVDATCHRTLQGPATGTQTKAVWVRQLQKDRSEERNSVGFVSSMPMVHIQFREFMNPHRNVRRPRKSFIRLSPSIEFHCFIAVPPKPKPTNVDGVCVTLLLKLQRIALDKSITTCSWQGSGLLKAVHRRIYSSDFFGICWNVPFKTYSLMWQQNKDIFWRCSWNFPPNTKLWLWVSPL